MPNPMIVGFELPERLPGSSKQLVGAARGGAFQPAHNDGQIHMGQYQQVHVIRHDRPGIEVIKVPFFFSDLNCFGHDTRDARIFQPARATTTAVQGSICCDEGVAGRKISIGAFADGEASIQAPRDENVDAFGLDVRQAAAVFEHKELAGETACSTLQVCSSAGASLHE